MPDISLGAHFDSFVEEQLASGRLQSASDVVRAGLHLLENQEAALAERRAELRRSVKEAFDDPRPSLLAGDVFTRLRAHHVEQDQTGRRAG